MNQTFFEDDLTVKTMSANCIVNIKSLGEVDNHRSLEIILKRLLERPLLLQIDLVNKAAVHYFVEELKIKEYFEALRSYVCMYDGMFGEALSKGIFNMVRIIFSCKIV